MSLQWFSPPKYRGKSLAEVAEMLAPLGVSVGSLEQRPCKYWVDQESGRIVKSIGYVTLSSSGKLQALPYLDATDRDIVVLLASAEDAFHNKPSKKGNWVFVRRPNGKSWWHTNVVIPADDDDPVALLVARQSDVSAPVAMDLTAQALT